MIRLDPALLKLLPSSRRLLVGLSGGLDSCVLLHLLAHHPIIEKNRMHALHIHHGLHADAAQWAVHCRQLCSSISVPLQVIDVDVVRNGGQGLEAAARQARYTAFADAMDEGDLLVTAHHRDDQAETFLLRALRTSGPDGLASMRPWRPFADGVHWRPLLETPRSALLAYAGEHGLTWIEDPGNADPAHDRNFLRHQVMPLLRERWPQVDSSFARSASLCAGAAELLADEDASALLSVRTADAHAVSTSALKQLPAARRARVLRRWIDELVLPPLPAEGIAQIESQLLDEGHDTEAAFAWSGAIVRRWRDLLHAERRSDPLPPGWRVEWDGTSPLRLPSGDVLLLTGTSLAGAPSTASTDTNAVEDRTQPAEDVAAVSAIASDQVFVVHARQGGERITLPARAHSHTLKHVLQDLDVPPWVRARLPLVSSPSGELFALGDLAYSAEFDAWLRRHDRCLQWIRTSVIPANDGQKQPRRFLPANAGD